LHAFIHKPFTADSGFEQLTNKGTKNGANREQVGIG
jgi:hypothetical protein